MGHVEKIVAVSAVALSAIFIAERDTAHSEHPSSGMEITYEGVNGTWKRVESAEEKAARERAKKDKADRREFEKLLNRHEPPPEPPPPLVKTRET